MEVSRRTRPSAPSRQPGALASIVAGGWRLGELFWRLPWRLMSASVDLTARTLAATLRLAEPAVDRAVVPGSGAGGVGRRDHVRTLAVAAVASRPRPAGSPARKVPAASAATPSIDSTSSGPDGAGETGTGGAAAGEELPTTSKEDRKMSCNCDQDLSGCELKVVQYTIVCVDPYISDSRRILSGPNTIATSDDMTDADFTAYVIALFLQEDPPPDVPHCDKQYLRVCYCVQCRLTMPCPDYEKQQVDALRQIARELGDDDHYRGKLERKQKAPVKK